MPRTHGEALWADAWLAIGSAVAVWGLGLSVFMLTLRLMFRDFGGQRPRPPRTGHVLFVLGPAAGTLAAPPLLVRGAAVHGLWLTCAVQAALPACTLVWIRRRFAWPRRHR
ncbi:hypothetical protein GTY65_12810 [Streptomyces sp. SID8379]|uniref:hypothetical protein n=1 Tax=unclassified Streptomyces TaxID=2593676 RepID=UPI001319E04B|nr:MULTISPECIES: hypothetical protein [unclassified Streptomyces]MYW64937.1 hypothetical protein [Streptomyces sp. SID8379]